MEKQLYTKYSTIPFTVLKLYIVVCAQTYIEKVPEYTKDHGLALGSDTCQLFNLG